MTSPVELSRYAKSRNVTNCALTNATCEDCGRKGRDVQVFLSVRTSVDLRELRARLCRFCRKARGFRIETFDRTEKDNQAA